VNKRSRTRPREVYFDDRAHVIWKDNYHSTYQYWDLRTNCPCAACVDELTGKKILDDATIPEDVHPVGSEYVGNYAIQIRWSDGHGTGIYTFKNLRDFYPGNTTPLS
jgi:ATP-binding protein involved in chromosome partitioning